MGEELKPPEQITYNPVYQVTYMGAYPTRGYVYNLAATPAAPLKAGDLEEVRKATLALAGEYRPSMDADVLHSWAGDAVAALRALTPSTAASGEPHA